MSTVSYETDEGIFLFDQEDVIDALKDLDSPDAIALIKFLKPQSGDKKRFLRERVSPMRS